MVSEDVTKCSSRKPHGPSYPKPKVSWHTSSKSLLPTQGVELLILAGIYYPWILLPGLLFQEAGVLKAQDKMTDLCSHPMPSGSKRRRITSPIPHWNETVPTVAMSSPQNSPVGNPMGFPVLPSGVPQRRPIMQDRSIPRTPQGLPRGHEHTPYQDFPSPYSPVDLWSGINNMNQALNNLTDEDNNSYYHMDTPRRNPISGNCFPETSIPTRGTRMSNQPGFNQNLHASYHVPSSRANNLPSTNVDNIMHSPVSRDNTPFTNNNTFINKHNRSDREISVIAIDSPSDDDKG